MESVWAGKNTHLAIKHAVTFKINWTGTRLKKTPEDWKLRQPLGQKPSCLQIRPILLVQTVSNAKKKSSGLCRKRKTLPRAPCVSYQVLHWRQQFFGEFGKLIKGRGHFLLSIVAEIYCQLLHGIDVWLQMWYVIWSEKIKHILYLQKYILCI